MDSDNDYDYDDDDNSVSIIDLNDAEANVFFNDDGGDNLDDVESTCAVIPDCKVRNAQRAVKSSFSALIKISNKNHKTIFINTVQNLVLKITKIAVCCGMIMHHVVMNCVALGIETPPNFGSPAFINAALNYNQVPAHDIYRRELLIAAIEAFNPNFTPVNHGMLGGGWLMGYLANLYCGHVIASTKAKWKKVIKDSLDAYGLIHLRDEGTQRRYRIKKEIRRLIHRPGSPRSNTAPQIIDPHALDLICFHRQGFRLQGQQVLDQRYINNSTDLFHFFILHYGHCLKRQELLESTWNDNQDHPSDCIRLKKCLPMPFNTREKRKSLYFDKRGLYFTLCEYRSAVRCCPENPNPNFQFPDGAPPNFPTAERRFNANMFADWMNYLFRIDKVVDGSKIFKNSGVVMTTNGVCASVLFWTPPDPVVERDEEESLLLSIQQLSLTSRDHDDDKSVVDDDFGSVGIFGDNINLVDDEFSEEENTRDGNDH